MIIVERYRPGGYDPIALNSNAAVWRDTTTRKTYRVDNSGQVTVSDFNENENAYADAQRRPGAADDVEHQIRLDIAAGIASLQVASQAAAADISISQGFQTDAQTLLASARAQRSTAAQFVPKVLYTPSDLVAIRDALLAVLDRQASILQALSDYYGYRAAVDQNAVKTDQALIYLARLAAHNLPEGT